MSLIFSYSDKKNLLNSDGEHNQINSENSEFNFSHILTRKV